MRTLSHLVVAAALAATPAVVVAVSAGHHAKQPAISISKATPSGRIVAVRVSIARYRMYPALVGKKTNRADGGHWHLIVDGKYNNFSAKETTGKTLKLKPGPHKIVAELANNDHSSLTPAVRSNAVRVRVP